MEKKIFNNVLIIDGSYMLHRSLKVPNLWELVNTNGQRSGGIFGFLRSLSYELSRYDYYPIVCWDLGLSQDRLRIYPQYKKHNVREFNKFIDNCESESDAIFRLEDMQFSMEYEEMISSIRSRFSEERLETLQSYRKEDDYVYQYHRQRDILINILNSLGIPSIKVGGWEGDDLMTLVKRLSKRSIVMTDDRDLIQLLDYNTDVVRPMQKQYLTKDSYLEDNNMFDIREMIIIKAIVGDSSDNISSVASGLGPKRASIIAKIILESDENPEVYLPILEDMHKPYYDRFIYNHDIYLRNMQLVDLSLVKNNATVINTIKSEVSSKVGTSNLISAIKLIGEQDISSFDVNSVIGKLIGLSQSVLIKE